MARQGKRAKLSNHTGDSKSLPAASGSKKNALVPHVPVFVGCGLFFLTFWTFFPVIHNGFVNFDDPVFLYENSHLRSGLTFDSIRWAFTNCEAGFWYPLTWLSHFMDFSLFGMRAGGHHFTSLLLHSINTVLLFLILRRATGNMWPSAFVAALFGLHPLHVEPVAWAADRKDVLCTTFLFLTVWAYLRYSEQLEKPNLDSKPFRSSRFWYCLSLIFFCLGLMSKTMIVTLPLILLALDWWPLRRFPMAAQKEVKPWPMRRLLLEKVPFLALALPAIWLTVRAQGGVNALPTTAEVSLTHRVANGILSYLRYVQQTVWPSNLAVHYPFPASFSIWIVIGCAALLLAITIAAVICAKTRPYLSFGWAWYAVSLLPIIGLIQIAGHAHADRYAHLPTIGLYIMITWGAFDILRHFHRRILLSAVSAAILLIPCVILSRQQISYWKNSETLFRHALAVTPDDEMAHNNLGSALAEKGDSDGAIAQWLEALRLFPDFAEAHCNLGSVLARKGQLADAIAHLTEGVRLNSNNPNAHFDLANALLKSGHADEAIVQYQGSLELMPDNPLGYLNLGHALCARGRIDEAIAALRAAVRLKPDNPEAENELGMAYGMQGHLDEAAIHLGRALELNPGYAEAHCNLGIVLVNQNKVDEAIAHLQLALKENPDYAQAHCNLGVALGKKGNWDEALAHLHEALRLRPDYIDAQNNLQAVLTLKGQSNK